MDSFQVPFGWENFLLRMRAMIRKERKDCSGKRGRFEIVFSVKDPLRGAPQKQIVQIHDSILI